MRWPEGKKKKWKGESMMQFPPSIICSGVARVRSKICTRSGMSDYLPAPLVENAKEPVELVCRLPAGVRVVPLTV